eukprot:3678775-Rhodomonas_salina.2
MIRSSVARFSTLLPRSGSVMMLHNSPLAFATSAPTFKPAQRRARLMSSDSKEQPKHPNIVHDMVHFKTSTNKHPLNIEKLSGDKQVGCA